MGPGTMILVFGMLSFQPTFSLSSFTFIKRLFSFSLLSTLRVVSCTYLRLLTFLPAILIPVCASSSLAFHMMYSAYKLNKQGDNTDLMYLMYSFPDLEPVCCSMSSLILQLVNLSKEYMGIRCTLFFNFSVDLNIFTRKIGENIVKNIIREAKCGNIFTVKIGGEYNKEKISLEKQWFKWFFLTSKTLWKTACSLAYIFIYTLSLMMK